MRVHRHSLARSCTLGEGRTRWDAKRTEGFPFLVFQTSAWMTLVYGVLVRPSRRAVLRSEGINRPFDVGLWSQPALLSDQHSMALIIRRKVASMRHPGTLRKRCLWYRVPADMSLPPCTLAKRPGKWLRTSCQPVACAGSSHCPSNPNEILRAKP